MKLNVGGVEFDSAELDWRKSGRSGSNGQCVEFACVGDMVAIRNSRHPEGQVLLFTKAEIAAFVGGVEDGDFAVFVE